MTGTRRQPQRKVADQEVQPVQADLSEQPDEELDEFFEPSVLDTSYMPARPGMYQRWVRWRTREGVDHSNIGRMHRLGYRPRTADTVDGEFMPPVLERFQKFGDVIGTHDLVLMEIPERKRRAIAKHYRDLSKRQDEAVKTNLYRIHDVSHAFGRPKVSNRSVVSHGSPGKMVRVQDD